MLRRCRALLRRRLWRSLGRRSAAFAAPATTTATATATLAGRWATTAAIIAGGLLSALLRI